MKLIAFGEAFNGDDVPALARRRKRQTGQNTLTFDDDRACAARALIAPLLRAGQTKHVAKRVQQRQARVQLEFVDRVVNADIGFHVDHLLSAQPPSFDAATISTCLDRTPICPRIALDAAAGREAGREKNCNNQHSVEVLSHGERQYRQNAGASRWNYFPGRNVRFCQALADAGFPQGRDGGRPRRPADGRRRDSRRSRRSDAMRGVPELRLRATARSFPFVEHSKHFRRALSGNQLNIGSSALRESSRPWYQPRRGPSRTRGARFLRRSFPRAA